MRKGACIRLLFSRTKLYVIAILSTLMLTVINLAAPKVLSEMTGIVSRGVDSAGMARIQG